MTKKKKFYSIDSCYEICLKKEKIEVNEMTGLERNLFTENALA
jgi:hypothetical protein